LTRTIVQAVDVRRTGIRQAVATSSAVMAGCKRAKHEEGSERDATDGWKVTGRPVSVRRGA